MLKARYIPYTLQFKQPARTSRSVMAEKETFFVAVYDDQTGVTGYGEAALFRGLSADDTPDFERRLAAACSAIDDIDIESITSSAIRFGIETALSDLTHGGTMRPFSDGDFAIPINGLVWMADKHTMIRQMRQKLDQGFRCIKIKIGGIDFDDELDMLATLRSEFAPDQVELRLDANGAFKPDDAMGKLNRLASYHIHSIEQPIKAGQLDAMAEICRKSPIPIALDEELIGLTSDADKLRMISYVKPAFVILKPSLCGGFAEADRWIAAAETEGVKWWATSALESNVGLNAIARWTAAKSLDMPQGLGTGALYDNNVGSPLVVKDAKISVDNTLQWDLSKI